MPPAPLAAGLIATFVLGLAAALLFGTALALPWRLAAVALLALAVGQPVATLAGVGARRTLGIDGRGRWWLRQGGGRAGYVQPGREALVLGRWVWLRLRAPRATHYLLIDGRRAEPEAFRRLQVALRLDC